MKPDIIGRNQGMIRVMEAIKKAALSDRNVLVLGETGTGKDLVARTIHESGPRRDRPFVAVNCANLSEGLLESELFGHAQGAFTGAVREKAGLLDEAGCGTAFLDEVGELSLAIQAKLLRLIDHRESRRLGGLRTRYIRARFVFATNREPLQEVAEGRFRRDLYYRINVVTIRIPALRDRKDDIPLLAAFFTEREALRTGFPVSLSNEALEKLMEYDYPGNVRELENIVERSIINADRGVIEPEHIRLEREDRLAKGSWTRSEVLHTLESCRFNKTLAARKLGTSRRQFYRILERLKLENLTRKVDS